MGCEPQCRDGGPGLKWGFLGGVRSVSLVGKLWIPGCGVLLNFLSNGELLKTFFFFN